MKLILSLLFLNVGFVISGFAQDLKNSEPKNFPLRTIPKSIQSELELPLHFFPDTLVFDSTRVFKPEGSFQEKYQKITPSTMEPTIPGIYALPDPQSRMPIKTFDDSVNYTILRKEYE